MCKYVGLMCRGMSMKVEGLLGILCEEQPVLLTHKPSCTSELCPLAFCVSTWTVKPSPQALFASSAHVSFNPLNPAVCLESVTLPFPDESGC